mgnify:CR=1 FL=1
MTNEQSSLIMALVGERNRLYSESPEFYHGIHLLARVLPRFVDLMAEDAMLAAQHHGKIIEFINLSGVE